MIGAPPVPLLNPLRALRIDRGLSVSELAEAAGMGRAALAAVESGYRTLTREQAIDLAQRLRVEPDLLAAYVGQDGEGQRVRLRSVE